MIQKMGKKAIVRLPAHFANCTVILEQVSETGLRIRKAESVPEDESPFLEELIPVSQYDRDLFVTLADNMSASEDPLWPRMSE
jgi:hypothetical protein